VPLPVTTPLVGHDLVCWLQDICTVAGPYPTCRTLHSRVSVTCHAGLSGTTDVPHLLLYPLHLPSFTTVYLPVALRSAFTCLYLDNSFGWWLVWFMPFGHLPHYATLDVPTCPDVTPHCLRYYRVTICRQAWTTDAAPSPPAFTTLPTTVPRL